MKTAGELRAILTGKYLWKIIGVICLLFVPILSFAADDQKTAGQAPPNETVESQTAGSAAQHSRDEAIDQARERIKKDPASLKEQVALGYRLVKKGSYAEAETIFDNVLSANAHFHEALTGKGIVLARMGKDQEAEEFLQKALVLNPNPVRTYYELGLLYEKKGDFVKANTEYKKGIEKFKQGRK